MTSPPVLKYYDPEAELVLQCNASETRLGPALMEDGKPVTTERNYAQIEKELLAIVFGADRYHQFTYGRRVMVESDHKPQETIFSKPLASAPKRLQKMLMRLQRYDLIIQYKKGKEMYLADTLSCHYLEAEDSATTAKVSHIRSKFEQELETDEGLDEINSC